MKLLIDIGNTTTSIGLWNNNKLSKVSNIQNNKFLNEVKKYIKTNITNVIFTSVISAKDNKLINTRLKKLFKCEVKQLKSTSSFLGVTNGYKQPSKLGDDRWVSIVASYITYKSPLIIVDCGTAVSIDIINNEGIHSGGYILAGIDGYKRCFENAYHLKNTKLKETTKLNKNSLPIATDDGITQGYLKMIISLIESIHDELNKNKQLSPRLLISGGYGKIISDNLSIKNNYEPNLVLRCLGVISRRI